MSFRIKEQFLTKIKDACKKIGWTFYIQSDSFHGIEGMYLGSRKFVETIIELTNGTTEESVTSPSHETVATNTQLQE